MLDSASNGAFFLNGFKKFLGDLTLRAIFEDFACELLFGGNVLNEFHLGGRSRPEGVKNFEFLSKHLNLKFR